jgi:hypothetical protein
MILTHSLLRAAVWAISLVFGGLGIFCLWASFYIPSVATYTIVFLGAATAITASLPKAER